MIKSLMRDSNRRFPTLAQPGDVSALRVWFCKYRTLAPVGDLINLRTLVVAGYPDVDLVPLASLHRLEYLRILDLPRIGDLTPLSGLQELRTLRLGTLPSWDSSHRVTEVASLAPVTRLPKLEHLELFGVCPADRSLADLEAAPQLRSVRVSQFPKAEVEQYSSRCRVSDEFAPAPLVLDWD